MAYLAMAQSEVASLQACPVRGCLDTIATNRLAKRAGETELRHDQVVLTRVGQALSELMIGKADRVVFSGYAYPGDDCFRLEAYRGDVLVDIYRPSLTDLYAQLHADLMSLRDALPFAPNPFDHFRYALSDTGKMQFDVAIVPREDSWAGVIMQRVSRMTEAEASAAFIPREDWQRYVKRFSATD